MVSKATGIDLFKVLSWKLSECAEENHEQPHIQIPNRQSNPGPPEYEMRHMVFSCFHINRYDSSYLSQASALSNCMRVFSDMLMIIRLVNILPASYGIECLLP
jgi:hypothetical protein